MKIKRLIAAFAVSTVAIVLVSTSGFVYAATQTQRCNGFIVFGISGCHGYLGNEVLYGTHGISGQNIMYNVADHADLAIPLSVNSAATFELFIHDNLASGTQYNKAGAAFLVDTMLGVAGGTLHSQANLISYAQSHLSQPVTGWDALVNYYSALGRIDWDDVVNVGPGDVNSLHACPTSITNADCTLNNMLADPGDYDALDYAWFNVVTGDDIELSHLIVFKNSDGTDYSIRRECANLIGVGAIKLEGLTPPTSLAAACSGFSVTPPDIDPNTKFNISASVSYDNTVDALLVYGLPGTSFYITVTGPTGATLYNQNVAMNLPTTPTITASATGIGPSHGTGVYVISWGIRTAFFGNVNCGGNGTVTGPTGGTNPPATINITDFPYVSVNGGDTSAGASISSAGTSCAVTSDPKAGIVSWNQEQQRGYVGAGTQYAALALNHLEDFATGQGSGLAPSGLSFANTADGGISGTNTGADFYGGMFDAEPCIQDYYGTPTSVHTGNVTIGATSVANGTYTTEYVKGNVYINGPITFSGSYSNPAQIPSFRLIVEGNIYIAPNVSRLDGLYVAEPSSSVSTDGVIYACATSPFTPAALDSTLYASCNNALTVNGSFVARQVELTRTAGTKTTTPSETFNFSPELWMSSIYDTSSGQGAGSLGKYDAITSLPPVL